MASNNTATAPTIQQTDAAASRAILSTAVEMIQSIYSTTILLPSSPNNIINVTPRNVGMIKAFYVELTATITNSSAVTLTPTKFNVANLLSQVVFTDLQNNVRINTAGWHLNGLNTARGGRPFGAAAMTDSPIMSSSNATSLIITAPSSIATSSSAVVQMLYKIPLAYSDHDLRGAIYANVVNSTMNLQLTVNPNVVGLAANDMGSYIYSGAAGATGSISNIKVNVYQEYLDQLPIGKNGPILPILALSTIYEIKATNLTGLSPSQDFPVPYANFRDFLSTFVVYDNGGTYNNGSDINYFSIQSANFTNLMKQDAGLTLFKSRMACGADFPSGVYYFSHRGRPLSTIQYGNMELIINPSAVNSGANLNVGFEAMALVNSITGAGSLAAG